MAGFVDPPHFAPQHEKVHDFWASAGYFTEWARRLMPSRALSLFVSRSFGGIPSAR